MRVHRVVMTAVSFFAAGAVQASGYQVTTVNYPGYGKSTTVTGIDHSGRVIGSFSVPGTSYAYGFSQMGSHYALLPDPPCRATRCESIPYAINSRGDIAGEFSDDILHRQVYVIRRGVLQLVPIPAKTELALLGGLNERGDLVGYFQADSGAIRMFVYSGTTVTVPSVPSNFVDVAPKGINNSGQIVGIYDDAKGLHSFLSKKGQYTRLDVPGALSTSAEALNEAGDVVGSYSIAGPHGQTLQRGFLYSKGKFTLIDFPGGNNTIATVIDNAGTIAGTYDDPKIAPPFNTKAFVLQHGTYTQLVLPGAAESVAAMAPNGAIAGSYFDGACPINCGIHGFRALPQ
jgi:uncharacterized membrane protein